ncbi:hypothetical protein [Candidatus Allofournierella merdipullorum]|uniref:hypothetical protein n=1 Tax=Candidatus Allofournierella merdipullorum TaxID=2838595 RepID=UPI002A8FF7D9|nr:hypothetical protein [Candidatus Fournierella merdipullorum]
MYKLEIFTDQMKFSDASMVQEQTVDLDYLTFDAFTLVSTPVRCRKGYFVHVTSGGSLVCDGVVSDVQPGDGTVSISIRPLQAMFDCEVFTTTIQDVATWLGDQIAQQFVNNVDALQNRPVAVRKKTRDVYPLTTEDKDTVKLLDVMASALTTYGIVCDCRLDMETLVVDVNIYRPEGSRTLEADLSNVLDKSVTLGDSYGAANKMVVRRQVTNEETGEVTYPEEKAFYLHPDGTVDEKDDDRVTPVFWLMKTIEDAEDWEQKALEEAVQELSPQQYDNEIILQYSEKDALARPAEMPIGARASIIVDGTTYQSILTGKTLETGTIKLVFGQVRAELTKRLILERRG